MKPTIDVKKIIRDKGWTLKAIGIRWNELSERQMTRIVNQNPIPIRDLDAINGLPSRVELKVAFHPSGRRTLMEKKGSATMFTDYQGEYLFGNSDAISFNSSLNAVIKKYQKEGYEVAFTGSHTRTNYHVIFLNDTEIPQPWMTFTRETFVSCRRIDSEYLDINLRHQINLVTQEYGVVNYKVKISPDNEHLLRTLGW